MANEELVDVQYIRPLLNRFETFLMKKFLITHHALLQTKYVLLL